MKKQLVLSKAMSLLLLCALVLTLFITGTAILDSQHNRNLYIREQLENNRLKNELKALQEDTNNNVAKQQWRSLGQFKITTYCGCYECNGKWTGYPTKLGTDYVEGRTVGVDPSVIPLGSKLLIDGHEYIAEDTGNFTGKIVDVYVSDHSKFYKDYKEVYIVANK